MFANVLHLLESISDSVGADVATLPKRVKDLIGKKDYHTLLLLRPHIMALRDAGMIKTLIDSIEESFDDDVISPWDVGEIPDAYQKTLIVMASPEIKGRVFNAVKKHGRSGENLLKYVPGVILNAIAGKSSKNKPVFTKLHQNFLGGLADSRAIFDATFDLMRYRLAVEALDNESYGIFDDVINAMVKAGIGRSVAFSFAKQILGVLKNKHRDLMVKNRPMRRIMHWVADVTPESRSSAHYSKSSDIEPATSTRSSS